MTEDQAKALIATAHGNTTPTDIVVCNTSSWSYAAAMNYTIDYELGGERYTIDGRYKVRRRLDKDRRRTRQDADGRGCER